LGEAFRQCEAQQTFGVQRFAVLAAEFLSDGYSAAVCRGGAL
jgi:hypothetical protein